MGLASNSADVPDQIGGYVVERRIGRGGMAEVFLGLNVRGTGAESFRKQVCIKRILAVHAGDPDFVRMFENEARVWALLDHPKIAKVFDFGRDRGAPYMVMEYVPGADLHKVLKQHRSLPFDVVYTILQDAAEALAFAHSSGPSRPPLVHRDISPSNFLVTAQGTVMLTDFGIAKALKHDHTKTDLIKGKLHYFAPETLVHKINDARTDLFAVGVTAYRALTGALPFDGDTEFLVLQRIVAGERPPVRELRPDCPDELVAIIDKLLEREPTQRFQTARALLEALPAIPARARLALGELVVAPADEGSRSEPEPRPETPAPESGPQLKTTIPDTPSAASPIDPDMPGTEPLGSVEATPLSDPHPEAGPAPPLGSRLWKGIAAASVLLAVGVAVAVISFVAWGGDDPRGERTRSPRVPTEATAHSQTTQPPPSESPIIESPIIESPIIESPIIEPPNVEPPHESADAPPDQGQSDDVIAGGSPSDDAPAEPSAAETQSEVARLSVVVVPFGELSLDGRPIAARRSYELPPGAHRLVATSGGRRQVREVVLEAGQRRREVFRF